MTILEIACLNFIKDEQGALNRLIINELKEHSKLCIAANPQYGNKPWSTLEIDNALKDLINSNLISKRDNHLFININEAFIEYEITKKITKTLAR